MFNFRTLEQGWPNSALQEGHRIYYGLAWGSNLCIHKSHWRAIELTRTPLFTNDIFIDIC